MAAMTISGEPWRHPRPEESQLCLVAVGEDVLRALARGDDGDPFVASLTPYLTGPECIGLWRRRMSQLAGTPSDAPWVTRFVVVPDQAGPVGLAGFHGAPDETGMVEVGYRIDPRQRRKGHARHALETLLAIAGGHPDVRVVRASISPDNHASRSLVGDYGFEVVGEQWDDEDGLEIIFEVDASTSKPDRQR